MRRCAALIALALLAACSAIDTSERRSTGVSSTAESKPGPGSGPGSPAGSNPSRTVEAEVYVAVGASETVGVGASSPARQAWPRVLHAEVMPDSEYVNVGVSGATAADALAHQLPRAVSADADVVTVWLAVNDLVAGVPVDSYAQTLERVLRALRRDGATVLVGNVPRLWELPVFADCLAAGEAQVGCATSTLPTLADAKALVAQYNAAIDRVAKATGAVVVDLRAVAVTPELVSLDGFHPSTEGHRRVGRAFADALVQADVLLQQEPSGAS